MREKPGRTKGFDPHKRKAKDNARQRKIASNNSDKAARRHAPKIKAMTNRRARRLDRQSLSVDMDDSADQMKCVLIQRHRHWGSSNAAEHRAQRGMYREKLNKVGGRLMLSKRFWETLAKTSTNPMLIQIAQSQIEDINIRVAHKRKGKSR